MVRIINIALGIMLLAQAPSGFCQAPVATSLAVSVINTAVERLSTLDEDGRKALEYTLREQASEVAARELRTKAEISSINKNMDASEAVRQNAVAAKSEQLVTQAAQREVLTVAAAIVSTGTVPSRPSPVELSALESIIDPTNPTLPTCGKKLPYRGTSFQVSWQATLDAFLNDYAPLLNAVGRLEVETEAYVPGPSGPMKQRRVTPVGTAFAIGDGRALLTAGHVANLFWNPGNGRFRDRVEALYFNTGGEHAFTCDTANTEARRVRVGTVKSMRWDGSLTAPDYAVLRIADGEKPVGNRLTVAQPAQHTLGDFLIVIGFPGDDSRIDEGKKRVMMNVPVEGGLMPIYDIKRIAPGKVRPRCLNAGGLHLSHDATTLNRSSGSPIFLASSGEVVGIQVQGLGDYPVESGYCNLGLTPHLVSQLTTEIAAAMAVQQATAAGTAQPSQPVVTPGPSALAATSPVESIPAAPAAKILTPTEPLVAYCGGSARKQGVAIAIVGAQANLIQLWDGTVPVTTDYAMRDHMGGKGGLGCDDVVRTDKTLAVRTGWRNDLLIVYGLSYAPSGAIAKVVAADWLPRDGVLRSETTRSGDLLVNYGRKSDLFQRFCWREREQEWWWSAGRYSSPQAAECKSPYPSQRTVFPTPTLTAR